MGYPQTLACPHGQLDLPHYLPDATFGQVRALSAEQTARCGVQALMMNTFHLMQKPGASTVKSLGGLHAMCAWPGIIFTDSGGFQAYSLIRQNARFGQLTEDGLVFRPAPNGRKYLLTPEKCIQLQLSFGSDVLFCLDDCTHIDDSDVEQQKSVTRTIQWAGRCRREFDRLLDEKRTPPDARSRLFAVVQGGHSRKLRQSCAQALLEIGFDGYGYGGWPLDSKGNLLEDIVKLTRDLVPPEFPMHALGIGHPINLSKTYLLGYDIFDCALPTRDARHGRLMRYTVPADTMLAPDGKWLENVYIQDKKYIKDSRPISPYCDCPVCHHYSIGYLHHLFKTGDWLYQRLATLHNLRFMTQLTQRLRNNAS